MGSRQKFVERRKKILDTFLKNPDASFANIGRLTGESRATARNVINRFKETKTIERKYGSGRVSGFVNKNLAKKVKSVLLKNPNMSLRDVAKKFNVSHMYVQKVKRKYKLRSFKVIKVPNRSDAIDKRAKMRARKLSKTVLNNFSGCILMDDETYVKKDFKQIPGLQYYTAFMKGGVKKKFKYKSVDKFAKKYLVWQAICSCGKYSKPFVTRGTLKRQTYIKECLEKRLLPFYKLHSIPPIFWPDLATIHYARETVEWLKAHNIDFVKKECNPPNCPEIRPIEKFWAQIKAKLRKTSKIARTEKDLYFRWNNAVTKFGRIGVQNIMRGLKQKIRAFALSSRET